MSEQDKPRTTRWRAWLLKKAKKLAVSVAVAVVLVVGVRTAVAEMFYAPTDAVAPEIPRNSRVLVYKLSTTLQPYDIVVYRSGGVAMLGRVELADGQTVVVSRAGSKNIRVPRRDVVGRVVLSTR